LRPTTRPKKQTVLFVVFHCFIVVSFSFSLLFYYFKIYLLSAPTVDMVALDIDANVLKVTMSCSFVLYLKFFCTTMIQGKEQFPANREHFFLIDYSFHISCGLLGGKRFAGGTRPPEDEQLSMAKKFKTKQTYGMEKSDNTKHAEADIRWQRIVLNDLGVCMCWNMLLLFFLNQRCDLCSFFMFCLTSVV
jgi:hypothetical protein